MANSFEQTLKQADSRVLDQMISDLKAEREAIIVQINQLENEVFYRDYPESRPKEGGK